MSSRSRIPRGAQRTAAFLQAVRRAIASIRPVPPTARTHRARRWPAGLAALLAGLAGIAAVVQRPARAERVAERAADSCPLTVEQEVAAVKALKGFLPVFREPRCLNCHGAVNPFAENGGHLGGDIDIREHAREWLRQNPRPPEGATPFERERFPKTLDGIRQVAESQQPITDNDFIRANAHEPMRAACKECHIDAWVIPMKQNQFVGRTDEELCAHLKTSELTSPADRFLQHMQDDELIRVAFKGTRGLESAVTPQPPAMSFATLEKFVNAWIDAMGGKFHQPADCGCVMPRLWLTMKTEMRGIAQGQTLTGEMSATVKLTADSSGFVYRGEAPFEHGRYTMPTPPGCRITYAPVGGALAVKEARFDAAGDGRLTINLLVYPANSGGTATVSCPKLPAMSIPLVPVAQEWRYVHEPDRVGVDYRFDQFETPTGASSEGGRTLLGRKELSRTVQRPEGVTVTVRTTFELWSVADPPK